MILGLLSSALMASAAPDIDPWLTIQRSPGVPTVYERIDVGGMWRTEADIIAQKPTEYWLRYIVREGGRKSVWWAKSSSCPSAKEMLSAVSALEMPKVWTPEVSAGDIMVTNDGRTYELTANAMYGGLFSSDLRVTARGETPLAAFVDDSLRRLHPCWTSKAPF